MKKILLLSAMSLLMFSCTNTPAKETISTPVAIGFEIVSLAGVLVQDIISNDIADSNIIFFILN